MKTRLFNIAAAVSLLLAIAVIFLWVRSYGRGEAICRIWHTSTEQGFWELQSGNSLLGFMLARDPYTGPPIAPSYDFEDYTPTDSIEFSQRARSRWLPFPPVRYQHPYNLRGGYDMRELAIAYWLLLPIALILPTIVFARHRRRRRREAGNLCPTCGYDLRAHNAGDRCPECGMVPSPAR